MVLTSSSVESSTASVALEVLCLLVGDEKLEILKVTLACRRSAFAFLFARIVGRVEGRKEGRALTVVAPRAAEKLVDAWLAALFLAHLVGW